MKIDKTLFNKTETDTDAAPHHVKLEVAEALEHVAREERSMSDATRRAIGKEALDHYSGAIRDLLQRAAMLAIDLQIPYEFTTRTPKVRKTKPAAPTASATAELTRISDPSQDPFALRGSDPESFEVFAVRSLLSEYDALQRDPVAKPESAIIREARQLGTASGVDEAPNFGEVTIMLYGVTATGRTESAAAYTWASRARWAVSSGIDALAA